MGDKDKINPAKETLKSIWAKGEYGELSLILDTNPAKMPEAQITKVPLSLLEPMTTMKRELAAVVAQEQNLEAELLGEEAKIDTPAATPRITELTRLYRELQPTKAVVEEALKRATRQVEKFEDEAMKLTLMQQYKWTPKCIAMISDMRNMCDPTLLQQLESHPEYSKAYAKRNPAEVWNTLTAVILAGLENDPRKAYQDAERHFNTIKQQDGELLTDWKRRVEAAFEDLTRKRRLYHESLDVAYNVGPLDDQKLAACHFIENLNGQYNELKAEISNDHAKLTPSMPETLGEALTRAQTFKSAKASVYSDLPIYAYTTISGSDKLRQGGNKQGKGGSAKNDHKKAQSDKYKPAGDRASETKTKRGCFLCESSEHWAQACPFKEQAVKAVKDKTAPRVTALATQVAD
jgi:hypothetical protein